MIDFLNSYSAHFIYLLLFFLLVLCGTGFPMAEELVLLAGGALVASRMLHPVPLLVFTLLGVIIGDVLLFCLGRSLAARMTSSAYLTRWISPQRLVTGEAFFARHGDITIFLARFIPGLRAPTFLLASTMQMQLWRFIIMDTVAAFAFVPIICWIGYLFADRFEIVAVWFQSFERVLFTLFVITGLSWIIWRCRGKRPGHLPPSSSSAVDVPNNF